MWNYQVHGEFPGKFESSNLNRENLSREIGRSAILHPPIVLLVCCLSSTRKSSSPCQCISQGPSPSPFLPPSLPPSPPPPLLPRANHANTHANHMNTCKSHQIRPAQFALVGGRTPSSLPPLPPFLPPSSLCSVSLSPGPSRPPPRFAAAI